jgi:hypothetical protein
MLTPWLSDVEVAALCEPLEQAAAQIRWLKREGYHVSKKPNGKPLLMRTELERVSGAARMTAATGTAQNASRQPDAAALLRVVNGGKRGTQAQGQ